MFTSLLAFVSLIAAQADRHGIVDATGENREVYAAFERLKERRLLVGYPESRCRPSEITRYEVAVCAYATARNAEDALADFRAGKSGSLDKLREMHLNLFRDLRFLTDKLARELVSLGVDMKAHRRMIASVRASVAGIVNERLNGQFLDVPLGHWAHDAVDRLRAKGVLKGYPDRRFKG